MSPNQAAEASHRKLEQETADFLSMLRNDGLAESKTLHTTLSHVLTTVTEALLFLFHFSLCDVSCQYRTRCNKSFIVGSVVLTETDMYYSGT